MTKTKKLLIAAIVAALAVGFGAWWTMFRVDDPEAVARDAAVKEQLDAFDKQFGDETDDDEDFADLEDELKAAE